MSSRKERQPSFGKRQGTPNQDWPTADEIARKLGIDPLKILLQIAAGDWQGLGYPTPTVIITTKLGSRGIDRITPEHRASAAAVAAQYLPPKKKNH